MKMLLILARKNVTISNQTQKGCDLVPILLVLRQHIFLKMLIRNKPDQVGPKFFF